MQYILTVEEYNKLIKAEQRVKDEIQSTIQDLCTKVCDHMPIDAGWRQEEPKPWRCILTISGEWYCDSCPTQDLCPNKYKNWSK